MTVAALFCCRSSPYWHLDNVEVFDEERDARTYCGPWPVVAHPPCRTWGRLSHMAKPNAQERDLALWAVATVRQFGGVLEHPADSKLFGTVLPRSGCVDEFGGFTIVVDQQWFGHRARKRTGLYFCGIGQFAVDKPPFWIGLPPRTVELMGRPERERTPMELATWLVAQARKCRARLLEAA
jgi:hypothetical protein